MFRTVDDAFQSFAIFNRFLIKDSKHGQSIIGPFTAFDGWAKVLAVFSVEVNKMQLHRIRTLNYKTQKLILVTFLSAVNYIKKIVPSYVWNCVFGANDVTVSPVKVHLGESVSAWQIAPGNLFYKRKNR